VAVGIAVPDPEDRVAGRPAVRHLHLDDAADADLFDRRVLEVGDSCPRQLALERSLLRHQDLLVLLGHLVLGVLAKVAVLAGRRDRLGVLGDLLRNDGLVLVAPALEAFL
jgi:hypothetical protein